MKPGQKSVKEKPALTSIEAAFNDDGLFENALKFPLHIQKELSEAGLEGRWLDAHQVADNAGVHKRGWVVYSYNTLRKKKDINDPMSFRFGEDPNGVVRRGTMVLGVKPKAAAERHRALLRQRADAVSPKSIKNKGKASIQQAAQDSGTEMQFKDDFEQS